MTPRMTTYTLRDRGADLRVETWVEEGKVPNRARLLVDGDEAGHPTRVAWWWTGRVARCVLVEPGPGHARHRRTPYAPPPGTRSARIHVWGERHPRLYAARHVVINVGGTMAAILGVSALLKAFFGSLLPRLDLGWLPDVQPPDWLNYLDPVRYLAPLFEWVPPLVEALFGWVPDANLGWAKYVIGFLVAVSIAVREVRRRKRIAEGTTADEEAQP